MGYRAYPQYKSSGDTWLGDVPHGWTVLRADFLCNPIKKQISEDKLSGLEVFHYSIPVVQEQGTGRIENGDEIDSAKLLIDQPQLLVSKLNPRKTTICLADKQEQLTVASGEFIQIASSKIEIKYAYYTWLSDKVTKLLSSRVQSVTRSHQRVVPEDIYKLNWAWPSQTEQNTIVNFLDHKTAQIDRLIEKKQELIEKLQEQRITIITQAVTKGLSSGVALKDSGIEWLGDVPAHWNIWRLRFSLTMSGGMTPSTTAPQYWEGPIPWVTPKDMKSDRISSSIDTLTELALEETSLQLYTPSQVLIVVRGMILAHTFPVGVNDVDVTVNQDMKVLSTTLNSEYLAILLRGFQSVVLSIVEESAHGTKVLRTDLFKNIQLPVPPCHEQEAIVAYIHRVIAKTDSRIEAVNTAISRLQEYRTALITAAVTGQIDVRDWQAPEPTKESAANKEVA